MTTFEEFVIFCNEQCFDNETANYSVCTETRFVDCVMYPKRILDLEYLVLATIVLLVMFLSGLLGNLSVCTVILKHPSMRTETNVYLFSLAVSDILLLLFGLAPELWYYWQMYPYVFGDFACRVTKFLAATGTWASALTVLAFSIERYLAICHHSRFGSRSYKRVAMAIAGIWTISFAVAAPILHVYHVAENPDLGYPPTGEVSWLTQTCKRREDEESVVRAFNKLYLATSVGFFFIPMVVLTVVYIRIALFIRSNRKRARRTGIKNNCSENTKIFKILVAVVLAFFVCGFPFHYQRLTTLESQPEDQEHNRKVLVITALFYYVSATINPVLYNVISKRYRRAFKEMINKSKNQDDMPMNTVAKGYVYTTADTSA